MQLIPIFGGKLYPLWYYAGSEQCKYYYFGSDMEAAHARYLAEWPDILGRQTLQKYEPKGLTVRQLANHCLTIKKAALDAGKLSLSKWYAY